jgi:sigma-E factor negative regulatory protein RseB
MRSVFGAPAHGSLPRSVVALSASRAFEILRTRCGSISLALCAAFNLVQMRPLFAQEDPAQQLLAQMSAAVGGTDYQGSFIYEHNGEIDALRLFHAGGSPDRERERLLSMSGTRSEIVRNGTSFTCLRSGQPTVLFEHRVGARLLPLMPEASALAASPWYAASVAGEDRVAGYRARIVEISARDAYRYGYRLWLDENSHLLLRSALVDGARRTLEQFMFVALDVGAKPKESDLQPGDDAGISAPADEAPLPGPAQWRVADPPPGFAFLRAERPAQGPTPAEHHLYTDGIANVSVYIEPRDSNAATVADRAMAHGALHIYSRDAGSWRITALGDVPGAAVERMARSVQPAVGGRG